MRAGLLRVVVVFLFASVASSSAKISAQSGAAPSGAAKAAASTSAGSAQAADSSAKYAVPGCAIDTAKPSDADKALQRRKFDDAERLYGAALEANPTSSVAMAGLVRTTLAEDKLPEALAMAMKYDSAHPNDAVLLDALGEVRFRRGEVHEAAVAFNQSAQLKPCNGVTRYDVARYLNLSGMYGSAQRQLEFAHTLSPENKQIEQQWGSSHAVPLKAEQQLALLKGRLDDSRLPELTPDRKDGIQAAIKGIETHEKASCEMVSPVTETRLPIVPISNGAIQKQQDMYAAGLDVLFNGKRKRMEIDTGASGLLLSRSVAKSAGLVPELQIKAGGIGDGGLADAFVTHVDDIKIGSMEFKNCMVQVLEQGSVLEVDGLIGPDVFRDYLVTLDIPGREMRIGPLPMRPDEPPALTTSLKTSEDDEMPISIADSAKDRYIAPEMKDWTHVFRAEHFLIFPAVIGNAPTKLFLMDTGAMGSMISPAAAREVTHVSSDTDIRVKGISGEVNNVLVADRISIDFGGVRQIMQSMTSYNNTMLSYTAGTEISGLIGFPALRELVISIDYRDNLVHLVYDPKKGFHAHN